MNKLDKVKNALKKEFGFKSPNDSFTEAFDLLSSSCHLTNRVMSHGHFKSEKQNQLIANNFVVNAVTSIELFCKLTIIRNKNWKESGLDNLLKEQISLTDAYDLFGKKGVSRQYIVSQYYSFQRIETIHSVFSKLCGLSDFFAEMEKCPISHYGESKQIGLVDRFPTWRKTLVKIFNVRHSFIHEGTQEPIKKDLLFEFFSITSEFMYSMSYFLYSKYELED